MSLPEPLQRNLLDLARESIRYGLKEGQHLPIHPQTWPPELREIRATFVTLSKNGTLRGCIGSLHASRPLVEDVARNAFHAAFEDPRFPPLEPEEIAHLDVHISILTPPEPLPCSSEVDLLQKLRPGVDGLILEEGERRATFLPAVWEDLTDPKDFVRHLKMKAGLPTGYWSGTLKAYRYTAESVP
jgi:AmmeMemoRadiSam system protein A